MVNATPRQLYPWERQPVPTVQEEGWAPGSVWAGAENLATTGIRSPDLPVRSESLQPTELSRPTSSKCGKGRCSALLRVSSKSEFQLSVSQTKGKGRKSCSGGNYLAAVRCSTNCANISHTELTNWGVRAWIQTRHRERLLPCIKIWHFLLEDNTGDFF